MLLVAYAASQRESNTGLPKRAARQSNDSGNTSNRTNVGVNTRQRILSSYSFSQPEPNRGRSRARSDWRFSTLYGQDDSYTQGMCVKR